MSDRELTLVDAVALAKGAEQRAAEMYSAAAQEMQNALVRRLFEQLAAFEQLHYEKLLDLERSLREKGAFIEYERAEDIPAPVTSEVKHIDTSERMSAVKALDRAIQVEVEAEKRYKALASQTSDREGRRMFEQLADEERNHLEVLQTAYFDLSNLRAVV